jgi:hypothetical protein
MKHLKAAIALKQALRNKYHAYSSRPFSPELIEPLRHTASQDTHTTCRARPSLNAHEVTIILAGEHNLDWVTTYSFRDILRGGPLAIRQPPRQKGKKRDYAINSPVL